MATIVLHKSKERVIDWVNPDTECVAITLEEYRNEMMAAEKSGCISFEDHKENMNQWLAEKRQ
jgi:hypothetical protein